MSERQIPLTDEQYDLLWDDLHRAKNCAAILAAMTKILTDEISRREREAWESARRLASSVEEADVHLGRLKIDWVSRCILVTEGAGEESGDG